MRRLSPLLIALIVLPLAGCEPAGRALASLQYHNIEFRLAKSKMTMTIGDGSVDLGALMRREVYRGSITSGRVTVEYPEGLEDAALKLSRSFDSFYPEVQRRLGVEWSFDLVLKLVRVDPGASGFRYRVTLKSNRRLAFPIPVTTEEADAAWVSLVAHEMTEASMLAPTRRAGLVLGDLYSGTFCIPTGTRWFRDGVSDYAQYLFHAGLTSRPVQPPGRVYLELNRTRERLLDWSNCQGQTNLYDAATGLICELLNRFGEDAVARTMEELSKEPVPDGSGLARAFKRVTGVDIEGFLTTYETPWAGFDVRDTTRPGSRENRVEVIKVHPATPASRRGIKVGDVIVSFAGETIGCSDQLAHALARQRTWQMAPVEIKRGDALIPMRLKLIPMPGRGGE